MIQRRGCPAGSAGAANSGGDNGGGEASAQPRAAQVVSISAAAVPAAATGGAVGAATAAADTAAKDESPYSWPSDSDEAADAAGTRTNHGHNAQCQDEPNADRPGLCESSAGAAESSLTAPDNTTHLSPVTAPAGARDMARGAEQCSALDGIDSGCSEADCDRGCGRRDQSGTSPAGVHDQQPGGGRPQPDERHLDPRAAPGGLREQQLAATVEGYRAAAYAYGIPYRYCPITPLPIDKGEPLL